MVWEIIACSILSSGGLPVDPDYISDVVPEVIESEETNEYIDSDSFDTADSNASDEIIIDYDYIIDSVIAGLSDSNVYDDSSVAVASDDEATLLATVGEIYNGTISTSILDYFDRLVVKLGNFSHYVLVRDGQYSYTLYYGDIDLSDSVFSGSCDSINITTYTGSSGYYAFSTAAGLDLSLDVSDYVVYSDLGLYPALGSTEQLPLFLILYAVILFMLCAYIGRIWKFELRGGGSYEKDGKDSPVVV